MSFIEEQHDRFKPRYDEFVRNLNASYETKYIEHKCHIKNGEDYTLNLSDLDFSYFFCLPIIIKEIYCDHAPLNISLFINGNPVYINNSYKDDLIKKEKYIISCAEIFGAFTTKSTPECIIQYLTQKRYKISGWDMYLYMCFLIYGRTELILKFDGIQNAVLTIKYISVYENLRDFSLPMIVPAGFSYHEGKKNIFIYSGGTGAWVYSEFAFPSYIQNMEKC